MRQQRRLAILEAVVTTLLVATLWILPVLAAQPRFASVVVTDNKDRPVHTTVFSSETPKIFVIFTLADVLRGTAVVCTWIAESTQVVPPNYVID